MENERQETNRASIVYQKKKFTEVIKDNLMKLMVLGISAMYIIQGLFTFTKRDTSIRVILGSMAMSLVVGIVLTGLFHRMGLKDGRKDALFKSSQSAYGEAKKQATDYFDKLPYWCEFKNNQELEMVKHEIITGANLSWKGYKFGYYEEHNDKLTDKQKEAIDRAKTISIYKLTASELLSDLPSDMRTGGLFGFGGKKTKFGKAEKDYNRDSAFSNVFGKIGTTIISGLYTIMPLINGENYQEVIANMLWNFMQVCMWVAFGIMKYYNSKSFIVDEYRQTHIIQKTEYLNEFIATMKNNPDCIKEFDNDIEIDLYIDNFIKEKTKGETNGSNKG